MNRRLLFIDTETGGVDPTKHSLLSIGVVVWDLEDGILHSDEFLIQSEEYAVTKTAQKINHFDRVNHDKAAVTKLAAVKAFRKIKDSYFEDYGKILLAGHNTHFDVQFIQKMFRDCNRSYEKMFSHRIVDTYSIIRYLEDSNIIPQTINSSSSAFRFFGISVDGRHSAIGDARATAELYSKLLCAIPTQTDN